MYTLRIIQKDGLQENVFIGETYSLIIDQISPKAFDEIAKDFGHGNLCYFFTIAKNAKLGFSCQHFFSA